MGFLVLTLGFDDSEKFFLIKKAQLTFHRGVY